MTRCAHFWKPSFARLQAAEKRLKAKLGSAYLVSVVRDEQEHHQQKYGKVKCPMCGAQPEHKCRTRRSKIEYPWSHVHIERKLAAR
jgi:hypothetical protein